LSDLKAGQDVKKQNSQNVVNMILKGVSDKSHDIGANLKRRARRLVVDRRVVHGTRKYDP
jgi:hypothetical protein